MNTYRNSEIVSAYQLEESERLVTRDGVRDVDAGTWVVYGEDGVRLMDDAPFRARYDVWEPQEDSQADSGESGQRGSGEDLFSPLGRTVDAVTEYLRTADADEVARVKAIEGESNSPRKGIMEFPA